MPALLLRAARLVLLANRLRLAVQTPRPRGPPRWAEPRWAGPRRAGRPALERRGRPDLQGRPARVPRARARTVAARQARAGARPASRPATSTRQVIRRAWRPIAQCGPCSARIPATCI